MSLKIERIRKDLTQKELSILSDVSVTTISRIEKWGIVKAATKFNNIEKLAAALDVPVEELIKDN